MTFAEKLAWIAAGIVSGFFIVFLVLASAVATFAHSFYPVECCHDRDCAPIDESRVKPGFAGYVVDGKHYVPMSQVRQSPDGQYHACFPNTETLKCFWAPPQGS